MEHFFERVKGWFSFRLVYETAVKEAPDPAHFVEIGCWQGRSACFMAVEIANSGKRIRFDCVDTWLGSRDMQDHREVIDGTLFDIFRANTAPIADLVNIVRMPSVEAAKQYRDGSLDFVFIDADHVYDCVSADIAAWWPKVKPGGVLAGDDAQGKGVDRAVREFFNDKFRHLPGTGKGCQWRVRKHADDSGLAMVG